MKATMLTLLMTALTALVGCQSTSGARGGSMLKGQGFAVSTPARAQQIKQGHIQSVPITLERGDYFKQDVRLQIDTTPGLNIDPTSVTVKASDSPDLQIRIGADQYAALGDYRVTVRATPQTGEPTSAIFIVRVVSP